MKKKAIWIAVIGLLVIALAATYYYTRRVQIGSNEPRKLLVVTSFYPLFFFSSQIASDSADVINITPSGVEPHDYDPTSQDYALMQRADLIVTNGKIEPWASDIFDERVLTDVNLIRTANDFSLADYTDEDGVVAQDPHVWLSLNFAKKIVDRIAGELTKLDPSKTALFKENAERLKNELTTLDGEYRTGLALCARNNFITSHAAFGYIASEYNLHQVSIAGLSPDAEPSPKDLATVSEFAKVNNLKYIFFESLVSPKLSQTIAREIGAQTLILNPLEGLTEAEIASFQNYFTIMRSNLTNLRIALECK